MKLFDGTVALIGMVHLKPLPGSPRYGGSMELVLRAAREDAATLLGAGFDSVLVENYGDLPFYPATVPAATIAAMAAILGSLRRDFPDTPWGVNVLRNDAQSAIAIAGATGAEYIRVNVHCGAAVTDQGVVQGMAHETLRARSLLARSTAILADVRVKHANPLAPGPVGEEASDLVERGLADGLLVTGAKTGSEASLRDFAEVVAAVPGTPILVASGISEGNAADFLAAGARGFIVGTSVKQDGRIEFPVDPERARRLVRRVRELAAERSR